MQGLDVVVALHLTVAPTDAREYSAIAHALGIGAATAHRAVGRLVASRLVDGPSRAVRPLALEEFLCHGLRYVFPVDPGPRSLGLPTAHSAPKFRDDFAGSSDDVLVWPCEDGTVRGASVDPLHPAAILAARSHEELYDLLAVADVLRLGRAREIRVATQYLQTLLRAPAGA